MMIRITVTLPVDPGHNSADVVVTWSPEYGFTVAGRTDLVTTEEIEPRSNLVMAPVLDVPMRQDKPRTVIPILNTCIVCNHPKHDTGDCTGKLSIGEAGMVDCDCLGG